MDDDKALYIYMYTRQYAIAIRGIGIEVYLIRSETSAYCAVYAICIAYTIYRYCIGRKLNRISKIT